MQHAFDGYAKLCSWTFKPAGNVSFTTQFLETNWYKESKKLGTVAPYLMFEASIPPFSWTEKVTALLRGIDNTNINVVRFGRGEDGFAALSDFWQMYQFNHSDLGTVGRVTPEVPPSGVPLTSAGLPLPSSAHPLKEHNSTNYINFVSLMNPIPFMKSSIRLVRIESLHKRSFISEISVDDVPYMHSFGLTKKYAIIFGHPMFVNIKKMLYTAQPINSLDWYRDRPVNIFVVNIHSGKVLKLQTEAIFMMHHVNSYEYDDEILIMDAVTYPNIDFIKSLQLKTLKDPLKRDQIKVDAKLRRFVLNLQTRSVKMIQFPTTPGAETVENMDMPAINEQYRHRKHCFVYGIVLKADNKHLENITLVKKNVCRARVDKVWYTPGHIPSEPWFVATPGAKREDDGIILSLILNTKKKKSYLGIFDARSMKRRNRGYVPTAIPFTLHGRFFEGFH